jgi:RNAse (barnase) inhibitor barstar
MADARFTAGRSGLFHVPTARRAALLAAAEKRGLAVRRVDLGACVNRRAALIELGRVLDLPQWYGANLDALHDCLTDSDILPASGLALFIDGMAAFARRDAQARTALTEVLRAAAQADGEEGYPFFVLFDAPCDGVTPFPEA